MRAGHQRCAAGTTTSSDNPAQVAFEGKSDAVSLGIVAEVDGPILEELRSHKTKVPSSSVLPKKLACAQGLTKKARALASGADTEDDQEKTYADETLNDLGQPPTLELHKIIQHQTVGRTKHGKRCRATRNDKGRAEKRSNPPSKTERPFLDVYEQKSERPTFKERNRIPTAQVRKATAQSSPLFSHPSPIPKDKVTYLPTNRKPTNSQQTATNRQHRYRLHQQKKLSDTKITGASQSTRATQTTKLSRPSIPIGTVVTSFMLALLFVLLIATLASQLLGSIFGFWKNENTNNATLEGLPSYISYEMVATALSCQESWGHPAACTLAQIIVESGSGEQLSGLAQRDNNLFGIKWSSEFAACPEVSSKDSWQTQEEYNGRFITIMTSFTKFTSFEACIQFRSRVLLQSSRYANNALIQQAISTRSSDTMAEGLKDAGYATDSSYVASLKAVMQTYNLYRFDAITLEDFEGGQTSGSAVVEAAHTQLGTPYVWGGTTAYVGLDCSGLTQWCYAQAGKQIPRNSEDQASSGTKIPLSDAKPGDILWRYGHVAIYIGGDSYIHAPRPGRTVSIDTGISQFSCAIRF